MSKYINADELLSRLPDDLPYKGSVKRVLMQAPGVDAVEVVRCNDCVYCEKIENEIIHIWSCFCTRFSVTREVDARDYCSCVERRTENG